MQVPSNYESHEVLGRGSFGVVHKVKDKTDDGIYALKIICDSSSDHAREAKSLATLDNPYIVRYYHSWFDDSQDETTNDNFNGQASPMDTGTMCSTVIDTEMPTVKLTDQEVRSGKTLYIKMEWCHTTLKKRLTEMTSANRLAAAKPMCKQLVEAVHYLTVKKKIHRDIKPANIFLTMEDQIKLGDFGLMIDGSSENPKMLTSGTSLYMSPEQKAGKPSYKSDVFSVALVLLELFLPVNNEGERDCLFDQAKRLDFPEELGKTHGTDLVRVIKGMLQPKESERLDIDGVKKNLGMFWFRAPVGSPVSGPL